MRKAIPIIMALMIYGCNPAYAGEVKCRPIAEVNKMIEKNRIEIVKQEFYSFHAHKWTMRRKNGDTLEGLYIWQENMLCIDRSKWEKML